MASLLDQRYVRKLFCQQRLLPQRAITIITELTNLVDHAMTWDQYCDRVVSDGCANCPHRARSADMWSDAFVRGHRAGRDLQQRFPNLQLEVSATQVHSQGFLAALADVKDRLNQRCRGSRVFDHPCLLPIRNKIVNRITFACLHKAQVANTAFGNSDQAFPEG